MIKLNNKRQTIALRYPEKELLSVQAKEIYCDPVKPLNYEKIHLSHQQEIDDVLDISDVIGKCILQTRLCPNINIIVCKDSQSAKERFGIDDRQYAIFTPELVVTFLMIRI